MNDEAPSSVLKRAIDHHRRGELTKAELDYQRLLESQPGHPDALHLLGVIAHQMGDSSAAIQRIRKSLSVKREQPIAWNNLGNTYSAMGNYEEAIECYREALSLNPDYAESHHNLGNALVDTGLLQEAIRTYRRSMSLQPEDVASQLSLAAVLERSGQLADAAANYREAIKRQPDSVVAHSRLGSVLRKLGRLDEAGDIYESWLKFDPENPVATHLHAACQPKTTSARASNEFIRATFDGIAEEFDECLKGLDYRVPELIAAAVDKLVSPARRGQLSIVDLGCGTGLCAQHLRDFAGRLIGVDLSPGMLAKAAEREIYDELVEAELTEFLSDRTQEYDLIVSADTLIYLGQLQPTFAAANAALCAGGYLVFTVEKMQNGPVDTEYRLNRFGRYAHTAAGLQHWLEESGFEICKFTEETLRNEGHQPVAGFLITARRPAQGTTLGRC